MANIANSPTRNSWSRTVLRFTWRNRTRESRVATTKTIPKTDTVIDVHPIFSPESSPNSEITSALVNTVRAADARIRFGCARAPSLVCLSAETEIATKSNPISAPDTPPLLIKKS
jgi:hypothetical protein